MQRRRMPPKLCHHKGTGRGYVTDPRTGREHYFGAWKSQECRDAYERWRRDYVGWCQTGVSEASSKNLIVGQLLHRWLSHCQQYYRKEGEETSEVNVARSAARFVRKLYMETLVEEFRPSHLRLVRDSMIEAGLARSSINALIRRIRACWKWGVARELVSETTYRALLAMEPLAAGRSKARETEAVRPVALSVVEATLPHLSSVTAAMVRVQLQGAMRPQDVCGMRPMDIDQTTLPWTYRPGRHKNQHKGFSRTVYLGPKAREVLTPWLDACPTPDTPIFRSQRGNKWAKDTYRQAIHLACEKGGIPPWNPHQLRHTMATVIRARHGVEAAQMALGLANVKTAEIYAERNEALAARVLEEMG